MTALSDAAVAYARSGIAVFPLRPRAKIPYGRTVGLHMADRDPALAEARWVGRKALPLQPIEKLRADAQKAAEKHGRPMPSDAELLRPVLAGPGSNVAIATGAPAGFWVLDLDGPEALAWLAAREAEHGPLPVTVEQLTARGRHLCFAWCADAAADPMIENRSGLDKAPVDVRGQGGYICAAPSVHPGDEKKGVPPGWVYRWAPGRSPLEIGFAKAPAWLITAVKPVKREANPAPIQPRAPAAGRASKFGEIVLDRACAAIAGARVGQRDTVLYRESCGVGQLVAGGEIEAAYALSALRGAGRAHMGDAYSEAQMERQIERAMDWGAQNPRSARSMRRDRPVEAAALSKPGRAVQKAVNVDDAWAAARPATGWAVTGWARALGLSLAGMGWALDRMRAHPALPDHDGISRPMLMAPMQGVETDPFDTFALFDLTPGHASSRPAGIVGGSVEGRAVLLTPMLDRPDDDLAVAIDLADAWMMLDRMGGSASGCGRAAATITLTGFAGGVAGDRFGRVDPRMPTGDPERAPWSLPAEAVRGPAEIGLLLRRDLITAPLKFRKVGGGSETVRLRGDDASAYFAGLATSAWRRRHGGRVIRAMTPETGDSFHEQFLAARLGPQASDERGGA